MRSSQGTCDSKGLGCFPTSRKTRKSAEAEMSVFRIWRARSIACEVSCYFELETQPDTLGRVTELLEQNETVTQVYRVTGKNKLHVHAVAASGDEMEKLIREVIDPLPGIVRCDCNIILSRIKDIKGLRL